MRHTTFVIATVLCLGNIGCEKKQEPEEVSAAELKAKEAIEAGEEKAKQAGEKAAKTKKSKTEPQPLSLGSKAVMADLKMKDVSGKETSLQDIAGKKGTLVVFTCNHCPWAKAWEERITKIGNAFQKKDIGVVAVNANDPKLHDEDSFDGMVARAKKLKLEFPYVVDAGSKLARAFGASTTPEAFVFDAEMKLVYHGTIDDNAQEPNKVKAHYLKDALEATVAGKAIPKAQTKAIGCSIKLQEA